MQIWDQDFNFPIIACFLYPVQPIETFENDKSKTWWSIQGYNFKQGLKIETENPVKFWFKDSLVTRQLGAQGFLER